MTPREIFLNGCNEIAANFADFKPMQKGQKISKKSADKTPSLRITAAAMQAANRIASEQNV